MMRKNYNDNNNNIASLRVLDNRSGVYNISTPDISILQKVIRVLGSNSYLTLGGLVFVHQSITNISP